jgi:hypothetical protein
MMSWTSCWVVNSFLFDISLIQASSLYLEYDNKDSYFLLSLTPLLISELLPGVFIHMKYHLSIEVQQNYL